MNEEISVSPIVGWTISAVMPYGAAMLQLDHLLHSMHPDAEATQSPNYLMTAAQCRDIAQSLLRTAAQLESGAAAGTGLPKH